MLLWIMGIYILLGVISAIIMVVKEPVLLYAWALFPLLVIGFPYFLYVIVFFPDNSGRWI